MPGPITQSPESQGPLSPLLTHLLSSNVLPGQQQSFGAVGQDVTKNFGNYNIFQQLGNKSVQLPRTNFAERTTQGIQNPIIKTAAQTVLGIPQSLVNVPSDFQQGATQTVNDIGSGQVLHPAKAASDVAALLSPVATVATMAPAAGVAKQGITQAIGTGMKYGAGFGALGGMESGRDLEQPIAWTENELKNIFLGGATGGVLGGATAAGSKGVQAAKKSIDEAIINHPDLQQGFFAGKSAVGFPMKKGDFTGLFQSLTDKQPRFEVSDAGAKLNTPALIESKKTGSVRLGDLLDHPKLYEQYPELKDYTVSPVFKISTDRGSFNPETKTFSLSVGADKDMKNTLLHEIQHAIQNKEGFASGGSPSMFHDEYKDLWGQVDKLNGQLFQASAKNDMVRYDQLMDQKMALVPRINELQGNAGVVGLQPYAKLAGEVESRDVAARADMTPQQRMETQPLSSQGIPLKDMIVRQDKGTVAGDIQPVTPESAMAKMKAGTKFGELSPEEQAAITNTKSETINEVSQGYKPGERVQADRASDMHKETFDQKPEMKKTAGEVQAEQQRAKGLGLLADLDAATNKESSSTDPAVQKAAREELRQIVVKIFSQPEDSPYAAYRKGLYSLMKMVKPFDESKME